MVRKSIEMDKTYRITKHKEKNIDFNEYFPSTGAQDTFIFVTVVFKLHFDNI